MFKCPWIAFFSAFILCALSWSAQGEEVTVRVKALQDLATLEAAAKDGKDAQALQPLVSALFASAREAGTPLTTEDKVTFLHFGPAREVSAHGAFCLENGDSSVTLKRLAPVDVWIGHVSGLPSDAEFLYRIHADGEPKADPLCKESHDGFGPNSVGRMPRNIAPPEMEYDPAIPHGEVQTFEFKSNILKNVRRIWVYLPPQYDKSKKRFPVLYIQDGDASMAAGKFDRIIDNLIARKAVQPIILCLIPPVNRVAEYWFEDKTYAQFITDEMVPFIDSRYRTLPKPEHRGITGASLGGRISTYISSARPDLFGICIGQSSYFEKDSQVIEQLKSKPNLPVRFYFDIGIFERGIARNFGKGFTRDLLAINRDLRDLLTSQGNKSVYREWPAGHCMLTWGRGMVAALQAMWPGPNAGS